MTKTNRMDMFEIKDNMMIIPSDRLTISAELAARIIHRNASNVRLGLQNGLFNWGVALERAKNEWTYFVYTCQFLEAFRIPYEVVLVENKKETL